MRISIWQQFSSNHSASFDVVGKFKTTEDAKAAADELNYALENITNWWRENKTDEWLHKVNAGQLIPPEQYLQTRYAVDWPRSIVGDLTWEWGLQIHVLKQHIFIESGEVMIGLQPLDQLVQRLGGEVVVAFSQGLGKPELGKEMSIKGSLSFTAPDEPTAQQLESAWRQFQSESSYPKIPPWLVYHNGKIDSQAELLNTT